jgi:uncharacterized protein YaiI (UPF0178 family)
MRILIDGDACPQSVKKICRDVASTYKIEAYVVSDLDRSFDDDGNEIDVQPVERAPEDYKMIQYAKKGDIVVTYDDSLASAIYHQVLAVIHPNGFIYNSTNIDQVLYERFMNRKYHEAGKGPHLKKRLPREDAAFRTVLMDYIKNVTP